MTNIHSNVYIVKVVLCKSFLEKKEKKNCSKINIHEILDAIETEKLIYTT